MRVNVYNYVMEWPDFRYLPVREKTEIYIGDLLARDEAGFILPALEIENPREFAKKFAGVALQASQEEDDWAVKVGIEGIFEFRCPRDEIYEVGDPVQVAMDETGKLDCKAVEAAESIYSAIGLVYRFCSGENSRVLVDIQPRMWSITARILARRLL